jgi:alpha-glucosidase
LKLILKLNDMKYRLLAAFFSLIMLSYGISNAQSEISVSPVLISSPDGKIKFSVLTKNDQLQYSVKYNNEAVITLSRLGLVINGTTYGTRITTSQVVRYKLNETYPYRGVHSIAINKCNGAKISIVSAGKPYVLEARIFNDGVAFRYVIKNSGDAIIEKDTTAFVLPAGSSIWSQSNIKYYEGAYSKKKIEQFKAGDLAGPPITVELPGGIFAAITEGGLTDFAGISLRADGANGFNANLAGSTKKNGKIETPWRIIEIGKDLNTLVNCDIIVNVSPPLDKKLFPNAYNTDWVKPGRSVWSYLTERRSITLNNQKLFSDLAAQLGFEYNLVDAGWHNWKDSATHKDSWAIMKELVDYSAKKGVGIWVWRAFVDRNGVPGIQDSAKWKEYFRKCKEIGVAGMKLDFFDSEQQDVIQFYQAGLRYAAELHLMIDFHGANKPTGETRTWPNEMGRESVRGMENRAPWALANTVLPFTRFLAGHADFTPVHFGARMGEVSWTHHIATMVIYASPLLVIGAEPQDILNNPAKELIKSIPTVWDETIVLPQSKIGDLAIYARRKADTWFLAAVNGLNEAKTLTVDLSFLNKGSYKLSLMKDDKAKQASAIIENNVTPGTTFTIDLNAAGGFVGRFDKIK